MQHRPPGHLSPKSPKQGSGRCDAVVRLCGVGMVEFSRDVSQVHMRGTCDGSAGGAECMHV